MDKTKLTILLAITIIASGCALPSNNTSNNDDGGNDGPSLAEDRGLRITQFRTTDDSLRPGQEVILNLKLKNYHTHDIEITEISTYNEGLLNVTPKEGPECTPNIGNLGTASAGTYPEMECQWRVTAPSEEAYGSFDSKPASVNLRLKYESSLTNEKPFKLDFKPLGEINNTRGIEKTFANSEVQMKVSTETPVPSDGSRLMTVTTKEIGQGRIVSDTNYSFSFTPEHLFSDDCFKEDAPVVGKELEFSCEIMSDGNQGTRNLVFSTSYKYVKEPVLNIRLVNNQ